MIPGPIETAFTNVFLNLEVLLVIFAAAAYGIFMGSVPGLTATMAVALLIPLTYFMDTTSALAAVVTLVASAIFAGDIPNTLLRIPGTPSSAAYTDDAYALTRQGRHQTALGVSLVFSVAGGIFGTLVLIFLARPLASLATSFSSFEYFWLYLLGLSCAALVSRGSSLKGSLALVIGLLISTIGLSAVHSEPRFTFGVPQLLKGIEFIPAMIGLFGVSEILRNMSGAATQIAPVVEKRGAVRETLAPAFQTFSGRFFHFLRSGTIGSLIGMLPGAGADIAAWVSKAISKRFSKRPEEYGKGSLEAIADSTAANNSALAGAWVPALVFGIPGDSVTALVIGVLTMHHVTPGPAIFENQGELVYSIYAMFLVANLFLLPLGFLAIRAGGLLIRIPRRVLLPCILLFCIVGSYAIRNSTLDIVVMLVMGLLGFFLERKKVPLGPVVLGIILGGPLEEKFIQSLTSSDGSIAAFFSRPAAAVLGIVCLALWASPLLFRKKIAIRRDDKMNENGTKQVRALISGKVQGVFFRDCTCTEARKLELDGWVRNVEDGKVEAIFKGPSETVKQMILWCKEEGSPRSSVSGIEVSEDSSNIDNNEFEIRY